MHIPGPMELMMRVAARLGYSFDGTDMEASTDQMLDRIEAYKNVGTDPLPAHETSSRRTPFTSHVPFRQKAMAKMRWRDFPAMIPEGLRFQRATNKGAAFWKQTFVPTRRVINRDELNALTAFLKSGGALDVGYLPNVDPRLVFAGKTLPERHALVFSVEMRKEAMASAPSADASNEVLRRYADLGEISAKACNWLRERGFAAYPGTNLGGQSDYPAMAEAAGIGAIGYHGLLIGPNAGARMRLCVIYVGIDNLPKAANPYLWVRDVCANCRRCVRSCPPGAIEPEPQPKANGYRRSIRATACRDYFARNYGCAICVKVCPFSDKGYDAVKASYDAAKAAGMKPAPLSTIRTPFQHNDEAPDGDSIGPRIAVVGAGPAGFYLAKALLERAPSAKVDILERLPFPHGLVRYGVAPDHPEVRDKGWTFDRMLEDPRVRLLAGLEVGTAISVDELRGRYDAVALTVGAAGDRRMGIEGEDLPGSLAAPDLVRWYNAHPDYADLDPRLGHRVVVVGHGNVALDTVRMLLTDPEKLITTDIMPEAAVRMASSQVKNVAIIGRTGPSQASFTPKELVELSELPGVQITVDPEDLKADLAQALPDEQAERRRRRNLELFERWAHAPIDLSKRAIVVRFFQDPVAILGDAHVTGFMVERTRVVVRNGRSAHEGLGHFETILCDSVIRAIGFKSVPVPGIPFDERRARFPVDEEGRIMADDGVPIPFVYASGWSRRGPVGVIGTNKTDAEQVASTLLCDLSAIGKRKNAPGLDSDAAPIGLKEWADIAREEKRRGAIRGHGPLRFNDRAEAVQWLESYGRRRLNDPTIPPEYPEVGRPDSARLHG